MSYISEDDRIEKEQAYRRKLREEASPSRKMDHNLSDGQFSSMKERHIGNALAAFDEAQASGDAEQS